MAILLRKLLRVRFIVVPSGGAFCATGSSIMLLRVAFVGNSVCSRHTVVARALTRHARVSTLWAVGRSTLLCAGGMEMLACCLSVLHGMCSTWTSPSWLNPLVGLSWAMAFRLTSRMTMLACSFLIDDRVSSARAEFLASWTLLCGRFSMDVSRTNFVVVFTRCFAMFHRVSLARTWLLGFRTWLRLSRRASGRMSSLLAGCLEMITGGLLVFKGMS